MTINASLENTNRINISVSEHNGGSYDIPVEFKLTGYDPKTITIRSVPEETGPTDMNITMVPEDGNGYVNEDITITVEGVTDGLSISKTDSKILDTIEGNVIKLTASTPISGSITINHSDHNPKTVDVKFSRNLESEVKVIPETATVNVENQVSMLVSSEYTDLRVSSDNPDITAQFKSARGRAARSVTNKELIVTATAPGDATITIEGEGVLMKQFVSFNNLQDLQALVTPSNEEFFNKEVFVEFLGITTEDGINITPESTVVSVEQVTDGTKVKYKLTSERPVTETVVFKSDGYNDYEVTVKFKDLETVVVTPNVGDGLAIYEEEVVELTLSGYTGDITAVSESDEVATAQLELNKLTITGISEGTTRINIQGENIKDMSVPVNVYSEDDIFKPVEPEPVLLDMPCDGEVHYSTVNKEIYFVAVTPEPDTELEVTLDPQEGIEMRKDKDRVYLKGTVEGKFKAITKYSGYKDSTVELNVGVEPTEIVPATKIWYDLGSAPVVELQYTNDNFVDKVIESPDLDTMEKRLAYILENGENDVKTTAMVLCEYQDKLGKHSIADVKTQMPHQTALLFNKLNGILKSDDYYSFRSNMKVVLMVMKKYKEDSFRIGSLLSVQSYWKGDTAYLDRFIMLMTFLTEYINKNGQGLVVDNLPFDLEVINRFKQFMTEEFIP